MAKEKIIIDTDPGIDDAVALAIALFNETVDVKLITTVAGNVSLEKVTANALRLLTFWGKKVPVAKGAEKPFIQKFVDAAGIHGQSGMDGFDFPEPDMSLLVKEHAVNKMREVIMAEKTITLVAIGPLTNVALLFALYPEVKTHISRIVLMGGSLTRGNKGVMAEFNFATDPHAAKMVFDAGVPLVMAGLDVGWQSAILPEDTAKLLTMGKTGQMVHALFKKYRSGTFATGLRMYDACAVAYLLKPEIFKTADVFVDIELSGKLTSGCSVVDLKGYLKQTANATVCTEIDPVAFRTWFIESLAKCI
ncbi:ribonucleoside hydrolase RihC [Treponema lecithinolyticum]|jgi:inosine-uridine preferring nucleoside hydrolase|uniref:Cytidine/uridine-specific hydrolase n=1 Tax=Treponema lecithinolyticum ATCC 700332 TaxID=1321815 RepID=A0ABN0NXF4_TRELE|nr:ribonucleoside hydrolase RihC [Treponema lecithinolyticum]ERJ92103.1 putative cytidine/uridine-specific hydrolase [Treponema lecithinolyticum ATCC 700332]